MAVTTQRSAREVLGEEAVAVLDPWMEEKAHQVLETEIQRVIEQRAVPRDEYREVLSRLDGLEKDVSLIKEELAGFRVELGQIRSESREDRGLMRAEFQEAQSQMRAEFKDGQSQMRAEFRDGQAQMRAEFREDLGELRRDMNERFDRMNERFDEMGARFEGRFDEMSHRMLIQTRWLIGSLTVLVTVVTALLTIAQFTP